MYPSEPDSIVYTFKDDLAQHYIWLCGTQDRYCHVLEDFRNHITWRMHMNKFAYCQYNHNSLLWARVISKEQFCRFLE